MWTCRFLSGVPFDTLIRGDGVGAAPREPRPRTDTRRASRRRYGAAMASLWSREPRPRRDATEPSATARPRRPTRARLRRSARGLRPRREQTRVESVAATAWGPEAVDAADRPRERAGLRETGQAAAAPRAPRERDVADGGADSRAQSSPVRHRHEVERAAEDATRPKPPRREQTADAGPRDHNATTPKTKQQHRSSTSTAARSSRSARRRSSSSAGRRRACCCARTSPRGA